MATESTDTSDSQRNFAEFFLHPDLCKDPDILYRGRTLVLILCSFLAFIPFAITVLFISPMPFSALLGGLIADCLAGLGIVVVLLRLKFSGNYVASSHIATAIPFVAVLFGIINTGGINHSPVTQLLLIPLMMAYFFNGVRGGVITSLLGVLAIVALMLIDLAGVSWIQMIPQSTALTAQGIALVLVFIIVTSLSVVYEHTSLQLKRDRDEKHREITRLAHTDPLTGLSNRRNFDNTLLERIKSCRDNESTEPVSLCYLDLNGFKKINDRHGHDVGDQVLSAIAIRLLSALRHADLVGRQGGDEFMLLLEDSGNSTAIKRNAERLLKVIAEPIETSAGLLAVSGSLGFALFPNDATDIDQLKRCADEAMYKAKNQNTGWAYFNDGNSLPDGTD